ncbi:unnamed protein product [Clonostachys chloroleuca]|uniref:Uncharacterized protein n=1 Tax=Clonostachys chloroleuca TaxID=1926264 RepID=A0AA35M412_9HYPO|nr:unnamed protein product [Clonostachys chloroleuca]
MALIGPLVPGRKRISLPARTLPPLKYLAYNLPSKVWSLRDLGHPDNQGISPFGVSELFRLFSDDAIDEMRTELFTNPKIWTDYYFSSKYAGS